MGMYCDERPAMYLSQLEQFADKLLSLSDWNSLTSELQRDSIRRAYKFPSD